MGCSSSMMPHGSGSRAKMQDRDVTVDDVVHRSAQAATHFKEFAEARGNLWLPWRDIYAAEASQPGAHEALGHMRDAFAGLADSSGKQANFNQTFFEALEEKNTQLHSILQRMKVVEKLRLQEANAEKALDAAKKKLEKTKQKLRTLEVQNKPDAVEKQKMQRNDDQAAVEARESSHSDAVRKRMEEEAKLCGDKARAVLAALVAENQSLQEFLRSSLQIATEEGQALSAIRLPEGPLLTPRQ